MGARRASVDTSDDGISSFAMVTCFQSFNALRRRISEQLFGRIGNVLVSPINREISFKLFVSISGALTEPNQ